MRVWVPFTNLRTETVQAMPRGVRYRFTGHTDLDYWAFLDERWEIAESFILVEHDVVPESGSLDAMWACPSLWCAVPYRVGDIVSSALGCTKFNTTIIRRYPDLISAIPIQHRQWFNLDALVVGTLHQHREVEHLHTPPARHLKYED